VDLGDTELLLQLQYHTIRVMVNKAEFGTYLVPYITAGESAALLFVHEQDSTLPIRQPLDI